MKNNKKEKQSKRQISILTVLLWIMLVIGMSTIVVQSIVKENVPLEDDEYITIEADFTDYFSGMNLSDSSQISIMKKYNIRMYDTVEPLGKIIESATYVENDGYIARYKIKKNDKAKYLVYIGVGDQRNRNGYIWRKFEISKICW